MGLLDKIFKRDTCSKCGGDLSDARVIYPSQERDVINITEGEKICRSCWDASHYVVGDSEHETKMLSSIALSMAEKKFQESLDLTEEMYAKGAKDCFYWYNRGNMISNLGRIDEAIECYNTALSLNTHYVKAWYRKGGALIRKGIETNSNETLIRALRCFVNATKLNDREWYGAAMFQAFMLAIYIHNKYVTSGMKPPEFVTDTIQETHLPIYMALMDSVSDSEDIKTFQEEQRAFLSIENEEQRKKAAAIALRVHMVDFCTIHFAQILDSLEPNIAAEIYNPEETEKAQISWSKDLT